MKDGKLERKHPPSASFLLEYFFTTNVSSAKARIPPFIKPPKERMR
jgi:hypothetical protein